MSEVKYWKTKDGTKIKIEEMETSHIKNAIKCLKNGRVKVTKTIQIPDFEQSDYHGISVYTTIEEDAQIDYLDVLESELVKRGEEID